MYLRLGPVAGCLVTGVVLSLGLLSCKEVTGGRLGSRADEGEAPSVGGGKIRALAGQLDFEIQANGRAEVATTPSSAPGVGQPESEAVPRIAVRVAQPAASRAAAAAVAAAPATVRMEFAIGFDMPVQSLESLAGNTQPFRKVGSLTTFNIVHVPADERLVTEEIGRPLYQVVKPDECAQKCFRLITGAGRVQDSAQVILFEFRESNGQWVLKGFNYFGNKVTEYGLPVRVISADRMDGM